MSVKRCLYGSYFSCCLRLSPWTVLRPLGKAVPTENRISSLSPPAGSSPANRPNSSRRCRRSPRSTSVCPWRTRSCSGSCTMETCWPAPAASPPPHPSAHLGTLPPSPQLHPYRPDNPHNKPPAPPAWTRQSCSKHRERLQSQQCCWILMINLYIWNKLHKRRLF